MVVQPGLCWTWSESLKTGFLTTRLISTLLAQASKVKTYELLKLECSNVDTEMLKYSLPMYDVLRSLKWKYLYTYQDIQGPGASCSKHR